MESSLSSLSYRIKEGSKSSDVPGSHPFLVRCIHDVFTKGTFRVDLVTNPYDTIGSIKSFIFDNYESFGYNHPPNRITIQSHDGLGRNIQLLQNDLSITENLNIIISS